MRLSERRVLVIMVAPDGDVQNRVIFTAQDYTSSQLQEASNYLTAHYAGLIDAMVADEAVAGLRVLECDTWMGAAGARRQVAEHVLALASELAG